MKKLFTVVDERHFGDISPFGNVIVVYESKEDAIERASSYGEGSYVTCELLPVHRIQIGKTPILVSEQL